MPKINSVTVPDLFDGEDTVHTITDFSLELGNNYTPYHFVNALFESEEGLAVVDLIYQSGIGLGDCVVFEYQGSYGKHSDSWGMCDLMDYLRPAYNQFYS